MILKVDIEQKDIQQGFGALSVEEIAATLYNAFHGHCECASHPFTWDDSGDFHGTVPWGEGRREASDEVVQAFRYAAIAAREALKSTGVGHLS
jgi:hypothetical protein